MSAHMQNNTAAENLTSAKPRPIIPVVPPTALTLKDLDPESLVENIPQWLADQIVAEWRALRSTEGTPVAQNKTARQYYSNTITLENKFAAEYNRDPGDINPTDILKTLFVHSKSINQATWRVYRSGFLHVYNDRATELEKRGLPQPSLIRALAALIVVSGKPYRDQRTKSVRRSRTKSISTAAFDKIKTHLATGYAEQNKIARRAQSFAMATIATGLRPYEWVGAKLRPAEDAEVPAGEQGAGWLAIEVHTAKRKAGEPDWKRTILVEPGIYQIHTRQHYEEMHAYLASEHGAANPMENYTKRCSRALRQACVELWPKKEGVKDPVRITLYTLRHQARANVAAAYGGFIAAAMMGHSPHTGTNWYSGKHRANVSNRRVKHAGVPVPVPGRDVQVKAMEFMNNPTLMEAAAPEDDDSDAL